MKLTEANLLLRDSYLALESGWLRLDDGMIDVAARTHMIGCTGAMVGWWFSFIHRTEHYLWWHPRDHIFSDWDGERGTGKYVGGTHLVHEYIGDELYKLRIHYREPAGGGISAIDGDQWFGHLVHLVQEIPEGWVMCSRFWLDDFAPNEYLIKRQGRANGADPRGAGARLEPACDRGDGDSSRVSSLHKGQVRIGKAPLEKRVGFGPGRAT